MVYPDAIIVGESLRVVSRIASGGLARGERAMRLERQVCWAYASKVLDEFYDVIVLAMAAWLVYNVWRPAGRLTIRYASCKKSLTFAISNTGFDMGTLLLRISASLNVGVRSMVAKMRDSQTS